MIRILVFAALALACWAPTRAHADPFVHVFTSQTEPGRVADYASAVRELRDIGRELGVESTTRIFVTTTGENFGNVVVVVEYPSLAAWADGVQKLSSSEKAAPVFERMDEFRTVQSVNLLSEVPLE